MHVWGGFPLLALATIAAFAGGMWASGVFVGPDRIKDPPEIVIDEVAGQWTALWAISLPAWLHGIEITALWPGWISAFVLFRLFDIWKPGPIGTADRWDTPLGVMLDDVLAGIAAGVVVLVAAAISHGWLM